MDFDIPIPRATKRPKRVARETAKAASGSTFRTLDNLVSQKNSGPTSRLGASRPGMPDPSLGSTGHGVSSDIPRISSSLPILSTTQSSISHKDPAATRTNLVSSPIDSIMARNTNLSQSSSSASVIAAAAAVRKRSLAQNLHNKNRSTQNRPVCVGDFIKGLRDGEPTQAVRDREASRKRRRGKSGDVERNDGNQNNGSSGSASTKAPSTDNFNMHSLDSEIAVSSVAGSASSSGNGDDTEKGSSAIGSSPQNRNIVPTVHMVDGNIVINQASMVFIPEANNTALEESNTTEEKQNRVTSASYSRRTPAMRWTVKDTRKFYDLLRQFGPNFAIIEEYFPQRTRRQIKNKFIKEEIQNRKLINWAVTARTGRTLEQFNLYLEKKYSKSTKVYDV